MWAKLTLHHLLQQRLTSTGHPTTESDGSRDRRSRFLSASAGYCDATHLREAVRTEQATTPSVQPARPGRRDGFVSRPPLGPAFASRDETARKPLPSAPCCQSTSQPRWSTPWMTADAIRTRQSKGPGAGACESRTTSSTGNDVRDTPRRCASTGATGAASQPTTALRQPSLHSQVFSRPSPFPPHRSQHQLRFLFPPAGRGDTTCTAGEGAPSPPSGGARSAKTRERRFTRVMTRWALASWLSPPVFSLALRAAPSTSAGRGSRRPS